MVATGRFIIDRQPSCRQGVTLAPLAAWLRLPGSGGRSAGKEILVLRRDHVVATKNDVVTQDVNVDARDETDVRDETHETRRKERDVRDERNET